MSDIQCSESLTDGEVLQMLNNAQDVSAGHFHELIKVMCKRRGGYNHVAQLAGMNASALRQSNNMRWRTLYSVLAALGLKIVIVPRKAALVELQQIHWQDKR